MQPLKLVSIDNSVSEDFDKVQPLFFNGNKMRRSSRA